jgi:pimeloyl-ACP methyl ester carboxylesterase
MAKVKWDSQPLDAWAQQHAKGEFIQLDGHQTHYIERGEETGRASVILLHGFFYDTFMWAENIDALAENHKVYALDLWGFGYSTRELMEYSYELYASQLLLFMDALGVEQASLVGQSLGGGIAIRFAVDYPQRVHKLILVDAAGMPNALPLSGKLIKAIPAMGHMMYAMNVDIMRKKGLADFFVHDKKMLTQEYFDNVTRFHKIRGTIAVMLRIIRRDFFYTLHDEIAQLSRLDKDILIVWGRHDNGNPLRLGQAMHRMLAGSKFAVIDNARHVPNAEAPGLFNRLASDFLGA